MSNLTVCRTLVIPSVVLAFLIVLRPAQAQVTCPGSDPEVLDCNGNGTDDFCDVGVASLRWRLRPNLTHPSPGPGLAMAYDSARGVVVLFGGSGGGLGGVETWEWDGNAWTLRATSGPSPRSHHAMAYDSARGVTVLFGGRDYYGTFHTLGDTWEWDGEAWALRATTGPSPRDLHDMAYDSARGVTVLFGGSDGANDGETWEWDGDTWALRSTSGPSPRYQHALAYDSARGVVVLFGGFDNGGRDGETWEWDGNAWTLRSASGPSPRSGHAMAYDSARGVAVLFGGFYYDGSHHYLRDTWEWDGNAWTLRSTSGPSPRSGHAMAYDSARGVVVLFGGLENGGPDGETWVFGPASTDCNLNGVPDECDTAAGTSADCNGNALPDECEFPSLDCNSNGAVDGCDIFAGTSRDCQDNGAPDECDIAAGSSQDCAGDGTPDECQTDCNDNDVEDSCDLAAGTSQDCAGDGVPDECQPDCNTNGVADNCDLLSGASLDCNTNGTPDDCEYPTVDCNANGTDDFCDIDAGASEDCNATGVPDECELDTQTFEHTIPVTPPIPVANTLPPAVHHFTVTEAGPIQDVDAGITMTHTWVSDLVISVAHGGTTVMLFNHQCGSKNHFNGTVWDDEADGPIACTAGHVGSFTPFSPLSAFNGIEASGTWTITVADTMSGDGGSLTAWFVRLSVLSGMGTNDCDDNGTPDECDPDCNENDLPDACDVAAGTSQDCTGDGTPDECEPDCNQNGVADSCDLAAGTSQDCAGDGVPDECQPDCNTNGVADNCDLLSGTSLDCNTNGTPDECEYPTVDCNANGAVDGCDIFGGTSQDCQANGVPDECDIAAATSQDCNTNGIPDECEPGCNGNGVPDICDLAAGTSQDCNSNGTPDECELDCNRNGVEDACDLAAGTSQDCNTNGTLDECDIGAASLHWTQQAAGGPSPRWSHALAYDSARGVTVLFGGYDGFLLSGETWEWDGNGWTLRATGGPSPRLGHALAYDSARGVTVLFGGSDGSYNGQTWEWDGATWILRATAGPSPRSGCAMAYDSARGVTVLVGGFYYDGSSHVLSDTWEWEGSAWTLRPTVGPGPRSGHAMTYDSARGVIVLFGGYDGSLLSGDTWEWNGSAWTLRATTGPSPRTSHALAHDSARDVTVLFGGYAGEYNGETWEWSGSAWHLRIQSGPAPRSSHAMAYDRERGEVVLFGGLSCFSSGGDGIGELLGCSRGGCPSDSYCLPFGDTWGRSPASSDCNANGTPDECDTAAGTSADCNDNGAPDECEFPGVDCNGNGAVDGCDIFAGTSRDCQANGVADECDISAGTSQDCQPDGTPDECEFGGSSTVYQVDDGVHNNVIGLGGGGSMAWLNHFTIVEGAETIVTITLAFGSVTNGTALTVYLWDDPDGDGDPADATVRAAAPTLAANSDSDVFNQVDLPDTLVGPAGTSFFVGAIIEHPAGQSPASIDETASQMRSWVAADSTVPIDPNNMGAAELPPAIIDSFGLPGNWLIRAEGTTGGDCNYNGVPDECETGGATVDTYAQTLSLPIPNNQPAGASTVIHVPDGGVIEDVNVELQIDHQAQGDLKVTLTHDGVTLVLINRPGSNQGCAPPASSYGYFADHYGLAGNPPSPLVLDDAAGAGIDCYAGSAASGAVGTFNYTGPARPTHALADFNGLDASGDWTLTVSDHLFYNTGMLNYWSLIIRNAAQGDCNSNGIPDECDIAGGGSADGNGNGVPDECEGAVVQAQVIHAVSRKTCDLPLAPGRSSEPRQGGVTQLRIAFDEPPGDPGAAPVSLEQKTCAAPEYVPYNGAALVNGRVVDHELVLTFTPGLENARSYRINLGPSISSALGQFLELRVLRGDVDGDGLVNATDRSAVVGAWAGPGFSCATDLNDDGFTNMSDRSIVVGVWTGSQNCAP